MAVHTWTVDELCSAIGDALRVVFPDELWIRGEIAGLRRSPAGHLYFDLIEPGATGRGADTRISVVAFRGPLRGIEAVLAKVGNLKLEDGIEVRIRGRIDYYPPQGRVQFLMNAIDPRYTLGQLAADREEVLRALAAEGLLELNRTRELALVPLRVGLITSDDSAAYNDFVDELHSSGYPFELTLVDARVQGVEAEMSLVAALGTMARRAVDVVALVRGGGARTDLVAFDQGTVARAVATFPVPVFVGIGHEIDRTVVDEVAHSSLKTPTACAVAVIERVRAFDHAVNRLAEAIAIRARQRLAGEREHIEREARHLERTTHATVRLQQQHLDSAQLRATRTAQRRLADERAGLDRSALRLLRSRTHARSAERDLRAVATRLRRSAIQRANSARRELDDRIRLVDALHPDRILQRGFSVTRDHDGRVVRDVPDTDAELVTETATATINSRVTAASEREQQ